MSRYLPREFGESGALRVSTMAERRFKPPPQNGRKSREIKEPVSVDESRVAANRQARLLRMINQQRFNASLRTRQRPTRVS